MLHAPVAVAEKHEMCAACRAVLMTHAKKTERRHIARTGVSFAAAADPHQQRHACGSGRSHVRAGDEHVARLWITFHNMLL